MLGNNRADRWIVSHIILIVDDDQSVRISLVRLLTALGYVALNAASASEAIVKASEIRPDAILMDLDMHPTSGIEAARQIKAKKGLDDIPVIAISSISLAYEEGESTQLFCSMLTKPCSAEQIVAAIEAQLEP